MTYFYAKGCPSTISYPVVAPLPAAGSKLHSPLVGVGYAGVIPAPNMPGGDTNEAFIAEALEVAAVRMDVITGKWPAWFLAKHHPDSSFDPNVIPIPLLIAEPSLVPRNPSTAAKTVHMDRPVDLAFACWSYLRKEKAPLKSPETGHVDFLQSVPDAHTAIAAAVSSALRDAFEVKYYYGKPRPEEVFAHYGLDQKLVTAYAEGCPNHPAYPAGHGAAAGAASALFDMYECTDEQRKQIFDAAYMWAQFRTLAGVHYAVDNLMGLRIGGLDI